jgi:hypothetical protein
MESDAEIILTGGQQGASLLGLLCPWVFFMQQWRHLNNGKKKRHKKTPEK